MVWSKLTLRMKSGKQIQRWKHGLEFGSKSPGCRRPAQRQAAMSPSFLRATD